jgi:hypothetical protein
MKTVLIITAVLASTACRSEPKAKPLLIGWRPIQTFSGHGNAQTDSFDIGSLQWRMKWATKNENPPGTGTFNMSVHSAISGRPLGDPVEHRGNGHGIAYINEDPRLYDLVIESSGVDRSVSVEESVLGREQSFRGYRQRTQPLLDTVSQKTYNLFHSAKGPSLFPWPAIQAARVRLRDNEVIYGRHRR